jgi:hypothetical protein
LLVLIQSFFEGLLFQLFENLFFSLLLCRNL